MKRNEQLEMERTIRAFSERGERPTLLLHCCCAPCSSAVMERLSGAFDLILWYYNPNIAPRDEYLRRADELERLSRALALPRRPEFLMGPYENDRFREAARGMEAIPEGGARCAVCFALRLERSAQMARALGCRWMATTLTLSPLKNAETINRIGVAQAQRFGINYLASDFKKKNGYLRSLQLSRQYGLYRQDYCGCVFSRRDG